MTVNEVAVEPESDAVDGRDDPIARPRFGT